MKLHKTRLRFTKTDLAAVLLGVGLCLLFALTARYGIGLHDEMSYHAIPHRLFLGERLISQEWHLTQFSYLVNTPVDHLFFFLTGSTEGIVLFTRYAFIAADLAYFFFLYSALRRYGGAGVLASFLFCALVPQLFFASSYATVSAAAVMAFCVLLFIGDRVKSGFRLFFAGVMLALGVLSQPFFVLGYFLWAAVAAACFFARKKRRANANEMPVLLQPRTFLWVTPGCVVVFAAVMAFLVSSGAFRDLKTVWPYLFTGVEYNAGNLIDLSIIRMAVSFYGAVPLAGQLCCIAAAAVLRVCGKEKNRRVSAGVFGFALLFLVLCTAHAALRLFPALSPQEEMCFSQFHNVPLLLFSPVPFLVSRQNDRDRICFLVCGLVFSLCADVSSRTLLGFGGYIVRVPALLQTADLLKTLRAEKELLLPSANASPARRKRLETLRGSAAAVFAALCVLAGAFWNGGYIAAETVYKPTEKLFLRTEEPLDRVLESGPLKGLCTTQMIGRVYNNILQDLDTIRAAAQGGVMILDNNTWMYLYLERPYATFSTVYAHEAERIAAYWRMPHTVKPEYIYVPLYHHSYWNRRDESIVLAQLEQMRSYLDFDYTYGKAGFIVHVRSLLRE